MPNPKRKISKTRRDKRRTHYKATAKQFIVDTATGEHHLPHRAYWHEGKLYFKGNVVMEKKSWHNRHGDSSLDILSL